MAKTFWVLTIFHIDYFDCLFFDVFEAIGLGILAIVFPAAFPKLFAKGFSLASGLVSNDLL
jgi:hypothetical protein